MRRRGERKRADFIKRHKQKEKEREPTKQNNKSLMKKGDGLTDFGIN